MVKDKINPDHYKSHPSGIECIEITRHHNFNIGNVIKYCWRQGLKEGETSLTDLKKAQWYLNDEISKIEKDFSGNEFNKLKNSVSNNGENKKLSLLNQELRFKVNYLLSLIKLVYHQDDWRVDETNASTTIISDSGCLSLNLRIDELFVGYVLKIEFKDGSSLETINLPKSYNELRDLIYEHIKITSSDHYENT